MKNKIQSFVLFLSLFFITFLQTSTHAQTDQGSILINGRTNLTFEFGDDAPLEIGVLGGYFFADNLVGGLDINYVKRESFSFTIIRPFVRYYLFKRLFFGTGLRYEIETIQNAPNPDPEFSWDLEVGGLIMISDQVGIEPTLRVPIPRESNVSLIIGFSLFF